MPARRLVTSNPANEGGPIESELRTVIEAKRRLTPARAAFTIGSLLFGQLVGDVTIFSARVAAGKATPGFSQRVRIMSVGEAAPIPPVTLPLVESTTSTTTRPTTTTSTTESSSGSNNQYDNASPATARALGQRMAAQRGWTGRQWNCLDWLWGSKESGWNVHAGNIHYAYGIPQADPGTKMASAGADWRNSAKLQIGWGLGYIASDYTTPCNAAAHERAHESY